MYLLDIMLIISFYYGNSFLSNYLNLDNDLQEFTKLGGDNESSRWYGKHVNKRFCVKLN